MDNLHVAERVGIGIRMESRVRHCLNDRYGYNFEAATFHEDCVDKVDCWHITKSGNRLRSAIKVRLNKYGELETVKTDILLDIYDPFYGVYDLRTKIGRDILFEYDMYISAIKSCIRVAKGKLVHKISLGMYKEGLSEIEKLKPKEKGFGSQLVFCSTIYPECQIWLHYDKFDRHPKLLAFIPPVILGKNIKNYDLPEEYERN